MDTHGKMQVICVDDAWVKITLPETNSSPLNNRPSQKEISSSNHPFSGAHPWKLFQVLDRAIHLEKYPTVTEHLRE